jgi:polyphosphate kinase 2 (PPK2 family)
VDARAQALWDRYTEYKEAMFSRTHTSFCPWIIVQANNKWRARLESMRYVLFTLPYAGKGDATITLQPDPNVVMRYHRSSKHLD